MNNAVEKMIGTASLQAAYTITGGILTQSKLLLKCSDGQVAQSLQ